MSICLSSEYILRTKIAGLGVAAVVQWDWWCLCSRTQVQSLIQCSGLMDLEGSSVRSLLWLESDPWPGNSICHGVTKKEKKKAIKLLDHMVNCMFFFFWYIKLFEELLNYFFTETIPFYFSNSNAQRFWFLYTLRKLDHFHLFGNSYANECDVVSLSGIVFLMLWDIMLSSLCKDQGKNVYSYHSYSLLRRKFYNKAKTGNKMHIDCKGRNKSVPICKYHDCVYRKSKRI